MDVHIPGSRAEAARATAASAPHGGAPRNLIALEQINKVYSNAQDTDTRVLTDINLTIPAGSFTVIRGESGSGKTTLLRILGMLDSNFEGQYDFGGVAVADLDSWAADELRSDNIGFIFQDGRMFDHLTVRENIAVGLKLRDGNLPQAEITRRVDELASQFLNPAELEKGLMENRPTQASGGQRQRASIMRSFVTSPPLILADEPTASLDEARKRDVLNMLIELHELGHTVVVVSHDKVFHTFGRQLELSYGRLRELDPGPQMQPVVMPVKRPPEGDSILFGWRPRAQLGILLRQVWRDIIRRPTFALMIAAALAAGATQIGVLQSLLTGAQDYIDVAVTQGSRLNRLQIKPHIADLEARDRFPLRAQIASWPQVEQVVPRRQTIAKIMNLRDEKISYVAMGLHDDDPEYRLLDFVAGAPFTAGNEELETLLTVTIVPDLFEDATKLADGSVTYDDFIGRQVQVLIPQFSSTGDLLREIPVNLTVKGIILAGEGGRQLYLPNKTSLTFDRMKMDRTGALALPLNAEANAWTDRAPLAGLQDFAWEDQLHVYTRQIRDIIPVFKQLSESGYKPQSDIWDFKWVLDIQALAQMISIPLLVLITLAVALTVWSNITASAKLQERELALWRILGMRRGDLVAMQMMATGLTVLIGTLVGLGIAWATVTAARHYLAAEATQPGVAAIFAPIDRFALLILGTSVLFGILVAIWPAQRTARADPAKVLNS